MKRSAIAKKKTRKLSGFDREFESMKSIVHERSRGECEALRLAMSTVEAKVGHGGFADGDLGQAYGQFVERLYDCVGRGVHVHHRKYRKRGGTNSIDNLLDVCEPCHSWIHSHGGFGRAANLLGLALSAGESEEI